MTSVASISKNELGPVDGYQQWNPPAFTLGETPGIFGELARDANIGGVIFFLSAPAIPLRRLHIARKLLKLHKDVFFFWETQQTIFKLEASHLKQQAVQWGKARIYRKFPRLFSGWRPKVQRIINATQEPTYLYCIPDCSAAGEFKNAQLDSLSAVHTLDLPVNQWRGTPGIDLEFETRKDISGLVICLNTAWPDSMHIDLAQIALSHEAPVWFYWKEVKLLQRITPKTLRRYRKDLFLGRFIKSKTLSRRALFTDVITNQFLYASPFLTQTCILEDERLTLLEERQQLRINLPEFSSSPGILRELETKFYFAGVVLQQNRGWPGRSHLKLAGQLLLRGYKVWFHWSQERALEEIDWERLKSYSRLWFFCQADRIIRGIRYWMRRPSDLADIMATRLIEQASEREIQGIVERGKLETQNIISNANPASFNLPQGFVSPDQPVAGTGVYLRMDFWCPINTGGSYGHTCYVAKELAKVTENFVCFMASRFTLLDEMGLRQIILDPPSQVGTEANIVKGTDHYYKALKPVLEILKPPYIYERIVLGNYAAAKLSRELDIPYIIEYNGSEISMKRSFEDGDSYEFEDLYLNAELAAFKQASLIVVISEAVKEDVVGRGVDPAKVLVNPNGADPDAYGPLTSEKKTELRKEFGWTDEHTVVGFTGTFGGWHGVDVLAESIQSICESAPHVRWMLIGDGNLKYLVDNAVVTHKLQDRVHSAGLVPQTEGQRLMKACDILVSPHSSHMVDSKFFGSPTKLFEYMAMGAGIVASDLEQIGQILHPSLSLAEIDSSSFQAKDQRAILCEPGNAKQFISSVVALANNLELRQTLGNNARQSVLDTFSWQKNIERIWRFAKGEEIDLFPQLKTDPEHSTANKPGLTRIDTEDDYKQEVQNQWNNDPAGSHYVKHTAQHTLEWFKEVEAYRYNIYAPWMHKTMEFAKHGGEKVLEIGGGIGTDLSQFAIHGAQTTDIDLSAGHLALAQENFQHRKLEGKFIHHDAETLPFADNSFDLVYSNGVIHHTPNTSHVVQEMFRVLKPGGRAIVMVYAEHSLHYWTELVWKLGLQKRLLEQMSIGAIMSQHVEISESDQKPLVKVYTKPRLKQMFSDFETIDIVQRQLIQDELPKRLRWMPLKLAGSLMGWNLIVKAQKPHSS